MGGGGRLPRRRVVPRRPPERRRRNRPLEPPRRSPRRAPRRRHLSVTPQKDLSMACHEIAALRLGLMKVLGIDDPAERAHELAELGDAANVPGPIASLMNATN